MSDIEKKVKVILTEIIKENNVDVSIDIKDIHESSSLTKDLGFDSFNLAQLTVVIESEFGVDIFEKGIITTFGDIINQLK